MRCILETLYFSKFKPFCNLCIGYRFYGDGILEGYIASEKYTTAAQLLKRHPEVMM